MRSSLYLAAAIAVIAAASVYGSILTGLIRQWYEDPDAAYGAVVAVAALLTAAQRRRSLAALTANGSRWGAVALAFAVALFLAGTLAADVFLLRVSLFSFVVATVWFVLGSAHLTLLAAPLTLLFVSIPLPSAVITEVTLPLQLAASRCAAGLLGLAGFAVVRDGNVLTLNYITLEVAEACSGMRSLVTLIALIAVYAVAYKATARRAAILIVAAVPVAILGNGLRVAVTGILASRIGESAAKGLIHDATGWIAFVLMCLALAAVHIVATRTARVMEPATS